MDPEASVPSQLSMNLRPACPEPKPGQGEGQTATALLWVPRENPSRQTTDGLRVVYGRSSVIVHRAFRFVNRLVEVRR